MEYYSCFSSPLGPLILRSDGISLTGLTLCRDSVPEDALPLWKPVRQWLEAYFAGRNPGVPTFPLKPRGTPFQEAVWALLRDIPYGETVTYGALAEKLSPDMSAQAVGGAVGKNPIAIIIPCHRVLGTGGKLTGYAYGLDAKRFLLSLEQIL